MPTYYQRPLTSDEIYHHGILGQKWGKTNGPPYPLDAEDHSSAEKKAGYQKSISNDNSNKNNYKVGSDGSISIKAGANLQRLVSPDSKGFGSESPFTYASFGEYDNAKYIKYIGGKGIFGGGRNVKLTLKAKKDLKSPSTEEATKEFLDLYKSDKKFRTEFENSPFGWKVKNKELEYMIKNPGSQDSKDFYYAYNIQLAYEDDMKYCNTAFKNRMVSKGYNMLRDENDSKKLTKNPIILLDPENTIDIAFREEITKQMRMDAKETIKLYKKGKKAVKFN